MDPRQLPCWVPHRRCCYPGASACDDRCTPTFLGMAINGYCLYPTFLLIQLVRNDNSCLRDCRANRTCGGMGVWIATPIVTLGLLVFWAMMLVIGIGFSWWYLIFDILFFAAWLLTGFYCLQQLPIGCQWRDPGHRHWHRGPYARFRGEWQDTNCTECCCSNCCYTDPDGPRTLPLDNQACDKPPESNMV